MNFIVAGSAVLLLHRQQGKPHVWFVLSDPDRDGKVLAVMLCTRRHHSDPTTVLAPGEYDFGDPVEGVIDYGQTRLFPVGKLESMIRRDRAKMCERLSDELLGRVKAGLRVSGYVPDWVVVYLDSL